MIKLTDKDVKNNYYKYAPYSLIKGETEESMNMMRNVEDIKGVK